MTLKENARIRWFYNGFRMDSSCSQDMQGIFTMGDMYAYANTHMHMHTCTLHVRAYYVHMMGCKWNHEELMIIGKTI